MLTAHFRLAATYIGDQNMYISSGLGKLQKSYCEQHHSSACTNIYLPTHHTQTPLQRAEVHVQAFAHFTRHTYTLPHTCIPANSHLLPILHARMHHTPLPRYAVASPTPLPDGSYNRLQLALDDCLARHQLTLLRQRHALDHSIRAVLASLLADEPVEVERLGTADACCLLYRRQLLSVPHANRIRNSIFNLTTNWQATTTASSQFERKCMQTPAQYTMIASCLQKHTLLTVPL